MLNLAVPLSLLLSLPSLGASSPLVPRQNTIAKCAPQAFEIDGFHTFTPAAGTGLPSSIGFTLKNPNPGGSASVSCSNSFADGKDPARDQWFSCIAGTTYNYISHGVLAAWDSMVCGGGDGDVVIATANGSIPLNCYSQNYPADQNGQHCETPTAFTNIKVISVV